MKTMYFFQQLRIRHAVGLPTVNGVNVVWAEIDHRLDVCSAKSQHMVATLKCNSCLEMFQMAGFQRK